MPRPKGTISVREAARRLKLDHSAVLYLMRKGKFPYVEYDERHRAIRVKDVEKEAERRLPKPNK